MHFFASKSAQRIVVFLLHSLLTQKNLESNYDLFSQALGHQNEQGKVILMIIKTEDPSLLQGRVTFINETPDRRFRCLPHVSDLKTGQSPGLSLILENYS